MSAYRGVRIADFTQGVAGPMACMLLGDFEADIVKVEPPGGDPARAVMVGDATTDTGSARAAGVHCVVCSFGYNDVPLAELGGVVPAAKADCEPKRFVREFRGAYEGAEVGQVLTVELFEGVVSVDVVGTTKGRGTAGVMKRHGFKGQRASHGVKKVHRHQGGTSMNTSPARVFKGKRMAGRFGNERSTMRNLKLVRIDKDHNLLLVRGAIPGPNGSYVVVKQTNKIKRVGGPATPTGKKKAGAK